jgi:sterol desaturase/sphingolipid hydroxylase (fatty acid hydroxylase superfamily)
MHPIDFALESILPFITGFFLVNSHLVSNLMFAAIAGVNNPHSHGGYAFFCLPLPDDHYLHHKVFNKNFALGFMDKLHGTVCSQTLKYRDDETKKIEN